MLQLLNSAVVATKAAKVGSGRQCGCMLIKLFMDTVFLEFHIFMCHKIFLIFFFQILVCQDIENKVVGQVWPLVCSLLTPGIFSYFLK